MLFRFDLIRKFLNRNALSFSTLFEVMHCLLVYLDVTHWCLPFIICRDADIGEWKLVRGSEDHHTIDLIHMGRHVLISPGCCFSALINSGMRSYQYLQLAIGRHSTLSITQQCCKLLIENGWVMLVPGAPEHRRPNCFSYHFRIC